MLKVIKRSGAIQPFDQKKIRTSILNASRDAGMPINNKEAKLLSEDVERQLTAVNGENGVTTSFEVRSMVRAALRELGFDNVSQLFERGKKDDLTDIQRHLQAIQDHTKALEELARENVGGSAVVKAEIETYISNNEKDLDDDDDEESDKTQLYKGLDD
ncbi:MAG: ATP cone domain-containing protein [Clostridiaceae bacterium]